MAAMALHRWSGRTPRSCSLTDPHWCWDSGHPQKSCSHRNYPSSDGGWGPTMGHRSHHVQVKKSRSTPNTPNSRPFSVAPSLRGVKTSWSRCRWFLNFLKVGKMFNPFSGSILPYLALSFCIRFWPGLAEKVNGGSVGVGAGAGLLDAKVGIAIFTSGLASKNDQKWWVSTVSTSKNSHPNIIRIITQHSPQTKFCTKVFMLWGAVGSTYEGARKIPKTVRVTKPSPMASSKS